MLRDLSYMLMPSSRINEYSTLCRVLLASSTIILLIIVRFASTNIIVETTRLVLIFIFELYLASLVRGFRGVLAGLKFILLFALIGALIFLVSYIAGWLAPDPMMLLPGVLRLVALFLSFSLVFQLVSLQEWRAVLNKLGLKNQAVLFSIVLSQIPVIIYYLSEATTTIKLKYRGRKLHKVATPLTLLSFLISRSLTESYLIYGLPACPDITFFKKGDLNLYLLFAMLLITLFVIINVML